MAGTKLAILLCCFVQHISGTDETSPSKLLARIEILEKQDAESTAVYLRQEHMIQEQARQLALTNDLVSGLHGLVLSQASEIESQRKQIEKLTQNLQELSENVKESENVNDLLTAGIRLLRNDLKSCTASNTELSEKLKFLEIVAPHQANNKLNNEIKRVETTQTSASGNNGIPKIGTKASANDLSGSDQRSSRFVLNNEGSFAFHAVSYRHEIPHISAGGSIVFENVLLNIGRALHTNHSLFIAEMPGVYLFSTSILSFVNEHSEFTAALVKNGGNLALVYGHGDSGRHDQGSVTVVTQLKAGDEVWVKLLSPADTSIYGGGYTTFSGVLLYSL